MTNAEGDTNGLLSFHTLLDPHSKPADVVAESLMRGDPEVERMTALNEPKWGNELPGFNLFFD